MNKKAKAIFWIAYASVFFIASYINTWEAYVVCALVAGIAMLIKDKTDGRKSFVIGIQIAAIVILMLLIAFKILFIGTPSIPITEIEKYESTMDKYCSNPKYHIRSGFLCFPDALPASTDLEQSSFSFSFRNSLFGTSVTVFLECVYDEKDFAAEIDRLEHAKRYAPLRKDDGSRFSYPAYYAIYNDLGAKDEYALITGPNRIAYIGLISVSKPKGVPSEYLPLHRGEASERFNVYKEYPEGNNDMGMEVDTERRLDGTGAQYYYEKISDTTFVLVRTEQDENGTERIARCVDGEITGDGFGIIETEIQKLEWLKGKPFGDIKLQEISDIIINKP